MGEELKRQVLDVLRRDSINHPGHNRGFYGGMTGT